MRPYVSPRFDVVDARGKVTVRVRRDDLLTLQVDGTLGSAVGVDENEYLPAAKLGVTKINMRECYSAVWVIFRLGIQNLLGASVLK